MAKFENASNYNNTDKENDSQKALIKIYFSRKNKIKNIFENTSSSLHELDDKLLNFNQTDKVIL